jgi:hypothetical protein
MLKRRHLIHLKISLSTMRKTRWRAWLQSHHVLIVSTDLAFFVHIVLPCSLDS